MQLGTAKEVESYSWLQVASSRTLQMTAKASFLFNILGCPNMKTANKKVQLCIAKGVESYYAYNIQSLIQCESNKHTYEHLENCVEPISSQPLQRSHAINSAMQQTYKRCLVESNKATKQQSNKATKQQSTARWRVAELHFL